MATDLGRVKPASNSKYDAFIASQLARAESRIRLLDLTAALLGFAALSLAYIVGMVLCDSRLELSQHTRQLSLYAFLAISAVYLFFMVIRPLRLRVNPYYAARQVEQLLPGAKNSIVNWVDLHAQPLPPAIRGALGQRAAKDLSHVDLESAISGRRAAWMGGAAALCVAAFVVSFLLLGPSPFFSLLARAFNPFGQVGVSTRTQLTLLKPAGGNTTVTVGRGVNFVVEVAGKRPDPKADDAVKLLYRYDEGEPWLERRLLPETNREWTTSLSAIEVKNGLWYKITGGDAATEEYRVSVRAAPAITYFLAMYHFRPYTARADEIRRERELKELRGTEVLLRVHTNRALRDGRLEFEGKDGLKIVPGEVTAEEPQTLFVRFVLNEEGKYRLNFTSTESEAYSDPVSYPVVVIPDKPPTVELTKPGQDIRLPTDALLHLEGRASDDFGVKSLLLRMQIVGGGKLQGQPYRSDDKLRLAGGGYPRDVEYKDFVELSRVQSEEGRPFALHAGMELEYWLEAGDACDYPQPNIAESKHYRVMLTEPENNAAKRQQEKKQAEQSKKQHEDKQDQKRQQENQERQQERKEQEARNKEAEQGAKGEQSQPKDGDKQGEQQNAGDDKKGQQNDSDNKLSQKEQETEKAIEDALKKQEQQQGEAKPDKGDQGEGKAAPQNKPNSGDEAGEKSEGEGKEAGQQGARETGEGKGQPQTGSDASQGEGKGDNQPNPMPGDKGEAKGDKPMNQPGSGQVGEGKGKPDKAPQQGEGKAGGNPQEGKNAGEGKPQPMGQGQDSAKGDGKPVDPKGQQAGQEGAGEAKDNVRGNTRSEAKGTGDNKDDGKAEVKQRGSTPKGDASAQGESKPSTGSAEGEKTAQGESKPDAGAQARNATTKDISDLVKALEGQDGKQREAAKQKLEQITKQARDPQAREKAEDALKQAGQPDGASEGKPPQPGKSSSSKPMGEGKDGKDDGSKDAGTSKPGDGDKKQGEGDAKGQEGGQGNKGQKNSSGEGKSRNAEGGNTPGGGTHRSGDNNHGTGGDPQAAPKKPSKPGEHRAAQMQLEDFAKKVNKQILKDAGVSEEAWKKYLEAKRKQLSPPEKLHTDTPASPQQATQLPSIGGRTIQPPSSGQDTDTHGPDRGQPPPGYRDSFRKFTEQMSKKK
ncbi:MAG TPA: DUF4175 family protein [Gemmataceae bacterium]|nr:DUF4175 family protein [Gemmataceae bacterium]